MRHFVFLSVLLGFVISSANADEKTTHSADFKLESWFIRANALGNHPTIHIQARYIGSSVVIVAPISLIGGGVVFGVPRGWKPSKFSGLEASSGSIDLPELKKGGCVGIAVRLDGLFERIPVGIAKIPIRVKVQPFGGEQNLSDPKKSSLKALNPIILTGFVTVTISPQQSQPKH